MVLLFSQARGTAPSTVAMLPRRPRRRILVPAVAICAFALAACTGKLRLRPVEPRAGSEHLRADVAHGRSAPVESRAEDPNSPRRRFAMALFTIYQQADAARTTAKPPPKSATVVSAAATVQELKSQFGGEYWRWMAIAKLASSGIKNPSFRRAIEAMGAKPQELERLLRKHPYAERFERQALVFNYLRRSAAVGSCKSSTVPQTTNSAKGWTATATTTVWLSLTLQQLADAADPQKWANTCAQPFFTDSYVVQSAGQTLPLQSQCVAAKGSPYPTNTVWHDDLYENFQAPSVSGDFYSNILKIDNVPGPNQYTLTYSLEDALCTHIGPDPTVPNGLFADGGGLIGQSAGNNWVLVTATKTIGFNDVFPSNSPQTLATEAAPMLELMGDNLPNWICCPQ